MEGGFPGGLDAGPGDGVKVGWVGWVVGTPIPFTLIRLSCSEGDPSGDSLGGDGRDALGGKMGRNGYGAEGMSPRGGASMPPTRWA